MKAFSEVEELKALLDECFLEEALRFSDIAPQYTLFSGSSDLDFRIMHHSTIFLRAKK
jgi:hypothetical protein